MAVIAAITTTALNPQVSAQLILISAGNAVQPVRAGLIPGGGVIGAPKPDALNATRAVGYPF